MDFSRLTKSARECFLQAGKIAQRNGSSVVGIPDLLSAVSTAAGTAGFHLLKTLGINAELITKIKTPPTAKRRSSKTGSPLLMDDALKMVLITAYKVAGRGGYPYVGTEHLVAAALESDDPVVSRLRRLADIKKDVITSILAESDGAPNPEFDKSLAADPSSSRRPSEILPNISKMLDFAESSRSQSGVHDEHGGEESALEHFCVDLSQNSTDSVLIGREKELQRIITVLCRKEKNNPLLIGDPGTGKTAVVEALASRIAAGDVPAPLMESRILSLDLASLVAGTTFRGEFEARLKDVIAEAQENPGVILFIDEIHTIVGAGNAQGALDAANILKPALARGDLRVIGATTFAEHQKHIQKDAALERRFAPVPLTEPTPEETVKILLGSRQRYEKFHRVTISPELIKAVVSAASRYVPEKFFPDKAFDLLDEAAAAARLRGTNNEVYRELLSRERMCRDVAQAKVAAITADDYEAALELREQEGILSEQIKRLQKEVQTDKSMIKVKIEDLISAVSILTGVPADKIRSELSANSNNRPAGEQIDKRLRRWQRQIVGQEEAVRAVSATIKRSYSGLSRTRRPLGSFLFLGPTGTGKTLTAATLAEELFDSPEALIRVDMSELSERHAVSSLLGSPAGYVGYEEGGRLTEKVRRTPHSVVLFDEIEKAHPDTLNILLQILEEGHLTDAKGRKVDFSQTVVVLTSNIGGERILNTDRLGFEKSNKDCLREDRATFDEQAVRKQLQQHLPPELLNRLDSVIVFKPLGKKELTRIAGKQIAALKKHLRSLQVRLETSPALARHIAAQSFSPADGARAVRTVIREKLENPLADILLTNAERPLTIQVSSDEKQISLCPH